MCEDFERMGLPSAADEMEQALWCRVPILNTVGRFFWQTVLLNTGDEIERSHRASYLRNGVGYTPSQVVLLRTGDRAEWALCACIVEPGRPLVMSVEDQASEGGRVQVTVAPESQT